MCGFGAIVTLDGSRPDGAALESMAAAIRHRGPDEDGFHVAGSVGFGFRRLSILDPTAAGHQPMATPDGKVVIVFNGAIYNFRELRHELEARGHVFRSHGDTEVLLHAYCEWGEECLSRLNGMWAFLIHDARKGIVFGSCDRFGEKPLFYLRGRDCVLFASEIKAIRASGACEAEFNWPVAADFLLAGEFDVPRPGHETLYRGVLRMPAAHAFEMRLDGTWRCWRYWSLDGIRPEPTADPAAEFAELFEQSVRLRLRSDVPVGVFLSGGLDSTSIICAMSRQMDEVGSGDRTLRAFCFHDDAFDEARYVASTIRQTGAERTVLETDPLSLWNALDEFFWHQEGPVTSISAVVGYKLAELAASRGVKVVLNGQGSDETLAGYPPSFRASWHTLLNRLQLAKAWREIGAYVRGHGGARWNLFLSTLVRFAKIHCQSFSLYRALSSRRARARHARNPWFTPDLTRHLGLGDMRDHVGELAHTLRVSISRYPLPLFLRVEDRNSMAHGIETRLPFLDHRLVEMAFRMGPQWFLRGPWNKFLLRESMRGRIPEPVRTRVDKMGFPTPMAEWFRGPLYEPLREIVTSREFRERGIYRPDVIERDLERHRRGEIDVADALWDILQWEKIVNIAAGDPAGTGIGQTAGRIRTQRGPERDPGI